MAARVSSLGSVRAVARLAAPSPTTRVRAPTPRLWSLLGDLHFMQKDYQESYDAYVRCVGIDPEYERAYLMMGYCAMQLEHTENALAALERAAEFPEQAAKANQLIAAVKYYAGQQWTRTR